MLIIFVMIGNKQINRLAERIVEKFHPRKILLFGSYATGSATEDSDIDLLVVVETTLPARSRYVAVRRLLADIDASFDIIVKTPDEYERSRRVVNDIVYFADKYGKVLYER